LDRVPCLEPETGLALLQIFLERLKFCGRLGYFRHLQQHYLGVTQVIQIIQQLLENAARLLGASV
jgi:hypothetical protein